MLVNSLVRSLLSADEWRRIDADTFLGRVMIPLFGSPPRN